MVVVGDLVVVMVMDMAEEPATEEGVVEEATEITI